MCVVITIYYSDLSKVPFDVLSHYAAERVETLNAITNRLETLGK